MEQREKDIQNLCLAVVDCTPNFYDNPNGGYEYTCPFCHEMTYGGMGEYIHMCDLEHTQDCAYLIAKDLSTNLI